MRRWFERLSIAVKVTIAPALAIVGLVALSVGTYAVCGELRQDFVYLNDTAFARFSDAARLQTVVAQVHAQLYRIISLANANDTQQAAAQTGAAEHALADIVERAKAQQSVTGNAHTTAAAESYAKAARGALDMVAVDPAMAILLMGTANDQFDKFSSTLQEVAAAADGERAMTFGGALSAIERARQAFLLGAAGAALLALAATVLVTRAISRPVGMLTRIMGTLAGGTRDVDIPYAERGDELGDMARAVQVFKEHAIEAERLVAEHEAAHAAKERRQAAMEQHTQDFGSSISGVMASLAGSADGMRRAAEAMSEAVTAVHTEASGTAGTAAKSSQDLMAVAAAVEQLTSSVAEISRQLAAASAVSQQAVQRAESSHATMQGLSEATARIGDVVHLINDIASQTNLLAFSLMILRNIRQLTWDLADSTRVIPMILRG